jgi:type I restriction enzyme S subunit
MSFPRYERYKDSGVEWLGEVPEGWSNARLAYACALVVDGTHFSPESHPEGDYRYVTAKNIKESGFDFSEITYVTRDNHEEIYSRCPVRKGDVLYIKDGATAGIAMVNTLDDEFSLLSSVALLRPRDGVLQAGYLAYHLNDPLFKSRVLASVQGGAMTRLTVDAISRFALVLPPPADQTAIVAFLDREIAKIDALIAEQQRLIELLKEKRQAVISHAVTMGLNPDAPMKDSGIEWLGEVPAHWDVRRLGFLADLIQTGPFGSQLHSEDYVENETPVINPSNIQDGQIIPDSSCTVGQEIVERLGQHKLMAGDIVIGRRGEMGRCARVSEKEVGWLCGTGSLNVRLNRLVVSEFVSIYLRTMYVRELLRLESVGSTMDNLNTAILSCIPLPIPPLEEQSAIAAFLDRETAKLDALTAEAQTAISFLQERRTALISAAVTGKIDVRRL